MPTTEHGSPSAQDTLASGHAPLPASGTGQSPGHALDQALIDEIVRRILAVARPDRIILFGSAAAGTMTRDSDIDLLVIEQDPGNQRQESVRLAQAIGSVGRPVDVKVISAQWFEDSKDVIGGIAFPANKYGKVIYVAE
jgi:predicted nucleotidyltransferase